MNYYEPEGVYFTQYKRQICDDCEINNSSYAEVAYVWQYNFVLHRGRRDVTKNWVDFCHEPKNSKFIKYTGCHKCNDNYKKLWYQWLNIPKENT